jgi:hypothetical protein
MVSLQQKVGALGGPAKLALGALAATVAAGGVYFLSTYEACEGCKRRREAMKAAFKDAGLGSLSVPPGSTAGLQAQQQQQGAEQPQRQAQ